MKPAWPQLPGRTNLSRLLVSLVLSLILVTPVSAVGGNPREPRPAPPPTRDDAFVPDQLLIGFDALLSPSARAQVLSSEHATLKRELAAPGLTLVELPAGSDVPAVAAAMQHRPGVVFAEPNFLYWLSANPNDPRFGDLWGLDNPSDHDIDAPEAWNITTGSVDVIVAVVDSGVDYTHPDLASNIWANPDEMADGVDNDGNGLVDDVRGWDFVGGDKNPMDLNGHGTHVAGTIGAQGNNGAGITGVNWRVSIMPLRAANAAGSLSNADIADSFAYACGEGARVINGSFSSPSYSQAILNAINACPQALFVFAAGNGGDDGIGDNNDASPTYPCGYSPANIVCVAASGPDDALTAFSNYGATRVDLAAPGLAILSASHQQNLFRDGFESGLGGWTANQTSGKPWSVTSEESASGDFSATDSAGQDYDNNSNTWIETSSPMSLSAGTSCALDYAFQLDTESGYDLLFVEGSADGGTSWSVIDGGAPGDEGWSGSTEGTFIDYTESLQADGFDGASSFDLRFRLISDTSIVHDGVHVDDVAVRCSTGSHGPDDFVMLDGTSMATPHVAGVAALVLAAHPNLRVASVKLALLDGVDQLPGLAGVVATGGRLNALGSLNAVDSVKPVAAAPTQRLVAGSTLTKSKVPLLVSWAAATDAAPSSGILRYRLQQRKKSGSTWGAWTTSGTTAKRTMTVNVSPGKYQFRLRALDRAGNWSNWTAGNSVLLKDPQGGSAITFGGRWLTQTSTSFFDGSSRYAGAQGRTALHTFTGRQVGWVSSKGPDRGRAQVYIDGTLVKTVNLYSSTYRHRRVIFLTTWGSSGSHTIQIKVISKSAGSSGSRIDLDAYLTLK